MRDRSQDPIVVAGGECFSDHRHPLWIVRELRELLALIYGLALGYEDLNDHEELHRDPLLTGLLVGNRPLPITLFPLMRLSGHSRSQETKWFSVSHLLMSYPASLTIVVAVMTSMLSIRVRSVPVITDRLAGLEDRLRSSASSADDSLITYEVDLDITKHPLTSVPGRASEFKSIIRKYIMKLST